MRNLLFVCSANVDRSPTAEAIYRNDPRFSVKSAGTAAYAFQRVSGELLDWADIVLVMEGGHRELILREFPEIDGGKIHCLDILDKFRFMDEELVRSIRDKAERVFDEVLAADSVVDRADDENLDSDEHLNAGGGDEPEISTEYDQELIDIIHLFAYKYEHGGYTLTLRKPEVLRLRRMLKGGLSGSYYRSGEVIPGDDIEAALVQDTAEFTMGRMKEMAKFYEVSLIEFVENLTRDEYCDEFLRRRRYPYEDPW